MMLFVVSNDISYLFVDCVIGLQFILSL